MPKYIAFLKLYLACLNVCIAFLYLDPQFSVCGKGCRSKRYGIYFAAQLNCEKGFSLYFCCHILLNYNTKVIQANSRSP